MPAANPAAELFSRMQASQPVFPGQRVVRPRQMKQEPKYQENSETPAQPDWPDYGDLGPVKPLNDVRILIAYVRRES
jgi:hypothetical protein